MSAPSHPRLCRVTSLPLLLVASRGELQACGEELGTQPGARRRPVCRPSVLLGEPASSPPSSSHVECGSCTLRADITCFHDCRVCPREVSPSACIPFLAVLGGQGGVRLPPTVPRLLSPPALCPQAAGAASPWPLRYWEGFSEPRGSLGPGGRSAWPRRGVHGRCCPAGVAISSLHTDQTPSSIPCGTVLSLILP